MKYIYALFLCCILSIFCSSCIPPRAFSFTYVNSAHLRDQSPTRVRRIYIDNSFGEADLVSIDDALHQWEYALNGYLVFRTEKFDVVGGSLAPYEEAHHGNAWLILKIDHNNLMSKAHDHPEEGTMGLAFVDRKEGSLYVVRDRLHNDNVRGIIMHEVGHLLGAEHIDESDDLMNPMYDDGNSQCIDLHTIQQVAHTLKVPYKNLNYCVYLTADGQPMKYNGAVREELKSDSKKRQ